MCCFSPEHEACTRDISELKWHLKLRRDKLHQVTDRLIKTEVLNRRLNEDIDFIKKNGPLVKEKLQLESDFMIQINTAQHKVLFTINFVQVFFYTVIVTYILHIFIYIFILGP